MTDSFLAAQPITTYFEHPRVRRTDERREPVGQRRRDGGVEHHAAAS